MTTYNSLSYLLLRRQSLTRQIRSCDSIMLSAVNNARRRTTKSDVLMAALRGHKLGVFRVVQSSRLATYQWPAAVTSGRGKHALVLHKLWCLPLSSGLPTRQSPHLTLVHVAEWPGMILNTVPTRDKTRAESPDTLLAKNKHSQTHRIHTRRRTWVTLLMSSPRAATSVATRMGVVPVLNRLRASSRSL